MAQIKLNIIGNTKGSPNSIDTVIQKVKADLKQIENVPIKINVDASGLEALDKSALKALQAQERTAQTANRLAQAQVNAQARMAEADAKRAVSADKVAISQNRLAIEQEKSTRATNNGTTATKQYNQATKEASGLTALLGNNLQTIVAKMAAWQIIGAGVATVIRSFKDAIETLKEVDAALVTVRKTTGFNEEQIDRLTEKTYELASAYGREADELLNLSATFARAGMGDQIEQMTELAALLENVGDLEGDTAAKFIIAANAAWKLHGNYSALMEIIDGMNAVTNEAAVDMQALTTGITVAGSVFANAGESAKTYTALVGTGVATTTRSGAEIGRALRTILMNTRQIKGELEDGEIIDEESISNAAKALNSIGVSVSENGDLRKFSDILDDLASKWDTLTGAEQAYVAESLANKRQANVLLAIMQNYGEYQRQLELYAGGAGSALKENELYLDSWEAKTKRLSAAGTKFISHLIETKEIKSGLDILTGAVNLLDSGFGKFAVTIGLVAVAATLLNKTVVALTTSTIAQTASFMAAYAATMGWGAALEALALGLAEVAMASPVFWVTAAVAAIYGLVKAYDALNVTAEEYAERVKESVDNYNTLQGEIDQLNSKIAENNRLIEEGNEAGASQLYISRLETENGLLQARLELKEKLAQQEKEKADKDARKAWNDKTYAVSTGSDVTADYFGTIMVEEKQYMSIVEYIDYLLDAAESTGEVSDELLDAYNTLLTISEGFDTGKEDVGQFTDEIERLTDRLSKCQGETNGAADETDNLANAMENAADAGDEQASALEGLIGKLDDLSGKLSVVKNAFEDFNDDGKLTFDTLSDIREKFDELGDEAIDGYIDRLVDANLTSEEFSSIMSDMTLALAETKIGTENLTESNRDYIERMLEGIGVQNASETATYLIAKAQETAKAATDRDTEAVEDYNNTPVEPSQKVGASNDITGAEVVQKQATDNAKGAIQGFNAQGVDSSSKVGAFNNITAAAAGLQAQIYNTHLQLNSFFNAAAKLGTKLGTQVETKLDNKAKWDARREGAVLSATAAKAEWFNGSGDFSGINWVPTGTGSTGKTGGSPSGTGATGSETDTYLESLKQAVSDEKARYELMEAQGAAAAELNAQAGNVQSALHAQAEYMRSIGASYSDVASLSKDWFSWEEKKSKNLEEERKARIQEYADAKEARENELAFLEASGADYDERIAKNREIQTALHNQAEYLRQIGASEEEILSLSTEWWKVEKEINDLEEERLKKKTQEYADDVDAYKNQLDFLEASGASEQMRIAKMRQIQDALHAQAEYMRSIGASEEDIRKLSTEWWNIENDILDLQDEIAQKLRDEIAKVMEDITEALTRQKEAILEPLNKELDSLKEAHELTENRREEEEKILAVEKARIALQNAQNERTVRQYNAATGQWEWVANAQTVEKARQSLVDAETALSEYYAQKEYEAAVNNLEKQIDYTDLAFKAFQDAWEEATEAVRDGKMSFQEAYAYIKRKMKEIYDEYGVDLSTTLEEAGATLLDSMDSFSKFIEVALQTDNPADAIKELGDAIRAGVIDNINDIGTILRALNGEYDGISYQTAKILALTQMQANSIAWHMTDDQATRDALHSENEALGRPIGLQYDAASGTWTDASGNAVYTLSNIGGSWTSALNTAILSIADFINNAAARALPEMAAGGSASGSSGGGSSSIVSSKTTGNLTTTQYKDGSRTTSTATGFTRSTSPTGATRTYFGVTQNEAKSKYENGKKYDAGGILRGLGGIKATEADEMILPPEMTAGLLKAEQNGAFDSLLRHLGIVTAAANNYSLFGSPTARSSIGSQHNGNVYQFGDVMLSEQQARSTSVYDLAQMAGTLPLHSA